MKYIHIAIILIILSSCNKDKSIQNNNIPLFKTIDVLNKEQDVILNYSYHLITLETSDSILLSTPVICDIKDSTMWVTSENIIYGFNSKNGKHLLTIDKKGNGPYEYTRIGDLKYVSENHRLYLYDYVSSKIITYTKTGTPINQFKNDTISSIGISNNGDIIASYNPYKSTSNLIGVYDTCFNKMTSFIKNNTVLADINFTRINPVLTFNNKSYIYIPDTLYQLTSNNAFPFLIINKDKYKIPIEIETDASKSNLRDTYIWNDYGFIVDQYYFLSFNYNKCTYFDIWDIDEKRLISRRTIDDYQQAIGVPFKINEQTIYLWPNYVDENKIYCILDQEQSLVLYPNYNVDSNPIILEIIINKKIIIIN